jgi:hypothetical protein
MLETLSSKLNWSNGSYDKYLIFRKLRLQLFINFCIATPEIKNHPKFINFLSNEFKEEAIKDDDIPKDSYF